MNERKPFTLPAVDPSDNLAALIAFLRERADAELALVPGYKVRDLVEDLQDCVSEINSERLEFEDEITVG